MTCAPASANRSARPSPATTAITARPGTGSWWCAWSAKCVTRIRCGRPMSMPCSIAAPTSSVWTCTFHSPSPPTTTTESPRPARFCRKSPILSSGASSRYITSYAGPSWLSGVFALGCDPRPVRRPARAARSAPTPSPPGSRPGPLPRRPRRPARRSTSSCSVVLVSACRADATAARHTSARLFPSFAAVIAPVAAARATVSMVPSTGCATAPYAASAAYFSASANATGSLIRGSAEARPSASWCRGRFSARRRPQARTSWEVMTPELPRAPSRAPRPNAWTASANVSSPWGSASQAASQVR